MIDPTSLDDIDDSNEWQVEEMHVNLENVEDSLVYYDDNLTWGDVAKASSIGERKTYTRVQDNSWEQRWM